MPWEDVRLSFEDFEKLKSEGKLAFGQLPALEVDQKTMLFQSASIMRFVGRYAGLYPVEDYLYAAKIDALVDQEIDLFTGLSVSRYRGKSIFIHILYISIC